MCGGCLVDVLLPVGRVGLCNNETGKGQGTRGLFVVKEAVRGRSIGPCFCRLRNDQGLFMVKEAVEKGERRREEEALVRLRVCFNGRSGGGREGALEWEATVAGGSVNQKLSGEVRRLGLRLLCRRAFPGYGDEAGLCSCSRYVVAMMTLQLGWPASYTGWGRRLGAGRQSIAKRRPVVIRMRGHLLLRSSCCPFMCWLQVKELLLFVREGRQGLRGWRQQMRSGMRCGRAGYCAARRGWTRMRTRGGCAG